MTAAELEQIYTILKNGEYSVSEIVEQTGFPEETIRLGIQKLDKAGYLDNGLDPPTGELRYTTEID